MTFRIFFHDTLQLTYNQYTIFRLIADLKYFFTFDTIFSNDSLNRIK